ncbi:diguanylate cyclase domain-containing protein [Faecalicatena contorta]|uniref:Diguanylate cyclase (GGDEF) domain-containing protein n=1 Tax=Faecalicatena contorta TaxID=39482 RepID=A0A315ZQG7_9FIRM|nr:diguanylate cyclase [Faecalicatena contorta]PWJ47230.1 diguanylate cyclase (GGDEF)-like protein [Faecalicatena contorta]SUQ16073.1 diguanylate cyclase (GGDEF) domain-containing protein [Faecalicatena contorta]
MRKLDIFKTIQLIVYIILTGLCVFRVMTDSEVYHYIATNSSIRMICVLLWVVLGVSFLFLFIDFSFFSSFKRDYRDLDFAVHSDPLSGIPNRFSCDALIEKYMDQPLPEDIGCIMFELSNIGEINRLYGHIEGNALIKDFSNILKTASINLCFIGRNGGNKFIALFEEGSEKKIETFLERIYFKVDSHNSGSDTRPIKYKYGRAFHEGTEVSTITDLVALANKRIYND